MLFPGAAVVVLAEFPTTGVNGAPVSAGPALAGAAEDNPGAGGFTAEAADAPPRLLT